jgi:hypothetical protein
MTTETLKAVQFLINQEGQRTAVLLDIQLWERLLTWIEEAIDTKVAIQSLTELQDAGGRPAQAGWLAWEEIREEWNVGKI